MNKDKDDLVAAYNKAFNTKANEKDSILNSFEFLRIMDRSVSDGVDYLSRFDKSNIEFDVDQLFKDILGEDANKLTGKMKEGELRKVYGVLRLDKTEPSMQYAILNMYKNYPFDIRLENRGDINNAAYDNFRWWPKEIKELKDIRTKLLGLAFEVYKTKEKQDLCTEEYIEQIDALAYALEVNYYAYADRGEIKKMFKFYKSEIEKDMEYITDMDGMLSIGLEHSIFMESLGGN
jgi:hypothetical protein